MELKLVIPIAAILIRTYAIEVGNNFLVNIATIVFFAGVILFFLDPFWKKRF